MNDLERKSFYSFLGLYIISSVLFVLLVGYWYYEAQKSALKNETYYRLQHITDAKAGEIIMAHMRKQPLKKSVVPQDIVLALIDTHNKVVEGRLIDPAIPIETGYKDFKEYSIFISDAPREHLNIAYVAAQSKRLPELLKALRSRVLQVTVFVLFFMILIAWALSRLFMKPVHQRVKQIERFINDVTHELNTPISALTMATEQALKQERCTQKTLKNISISTKQLYDIYRSLTYLNFSNTEKATEKVDMVSILQKSIAYYRPLAELKHIDFDVALAQTEYSIPEAQLTLLLGNLIGNAIKYSPPRSTVMISLKDRILTIKDEGIGIEPDKQKEIFDKFKRGTAYSGGFGVGLSIVKSICDEYGIEIKVNSTINKGSEFRLVL